MSYPPQGTGLDDTDILAAIQTVLTETEAALAALQVVDPGSIGNVTTNQLLGNRNDDHDASTMFGRLHDLWEDTHHAQKVWPSLAGAVLITTHADAWTLGNYAEIVAANAISTIFHIHHIQIVSPDANGEYELVLYVATTELMRVSFSRTDKKDDVEGLEVRAAHCPANSQIQAKIASSNAASTDELKVKLWYHLHS